MGIRARPSWSVHASPSWDVRGPASWAVRAAAVRPAGGSACGRRRPREPRGLSLALLVAACSGGGPGQAGPSAGSRTAHPATAAGPRPTRAAGPPVGGHRSVCR